LDEEEKTREDGRQRERENERRLAALSHPDTQAAVLCTVVSQAARLLLERACKKPHAPKEWLHGRVSLILQQGASSLPIAETSAAKGLEPSARLTSPAVDTLETSSLAAQVLEGSNSNALSLPAHAVELNHEANAALTPPFSMARAHGYGQTIGHFHHSSICPMLPPLPRAMLSGKAGESPKVFDKCLMILPGRRFL
jgi:hypothetical protein